MANKQSNLEAWVESLKSEETNVAANKATTTSIVKWASDAFGVRAERATSNGKLSVWCIVYNALKIAFKGLNSYYTQITMHAKTHHRHVSNITTSALRISQTRRNPASVPTEPFHSRCKLDSHANTIVAGRNCAILRYTDRSYNVATFSEHYTPMRDVPIISAATGYTSANGMNYIIVFNEALYMGERMELHCNCGPCTWV